MLTIPYLEFVEGSWGEIRDKKLKHPAAAPGAHDMDSTIPAIEVADHAHPLSIRCPDRKAGPRNVIEGHRVGAEDAVNVVMAALAKEVKVKIREEGSKGVGVHVLAPAAAFVLPSDDMVGRDGIPDFDARFKEVGPGDSGQLWALKADPRPFCPREEGAEYLHTVVAMTPEDLKRVMVAGVKKTLKKRA